MFRSLITTPAASAALRFLVILTLAACHVADSAADSVGPVPDSVRQRLKLPDFYAKHIDVGGLPILGSDKVSDHALIEAAWIVRHVLENRDDLIRVMATNNVRVVIMAHNEFTTDVPEQKGMTPKVFWDRRARGLGGELVSGAEENLLCFPNDPYSTENILIHEFAHTLHEVALRVADPTFESRLRKAFDAATGRGLFKATYAGTNPSEYWAEGVQDWFDDNRQNDALHNHVNTRAELKEYDPALAGLCAEVLGDNPWRYLKPTLRPAADRAHLAGYDPSKAPRFAWREEPLVPMPRVLIQTEIGDFEVELDAERAPVTTKNFLRYALAGLYSDGAFHRTVNLSNQPADEVKIQVVQASANPAKEAEAFPPILLERTRDTGLRHVDGAISMARVGPDTATHEFFICIGDQPELDFGGRRNQDGQGFAAFGRVVKGMDVVGRIHASPSEGQKLTPRVRIQRAIRVK